MNQPPLVSIIIPAYNEGRRLPQTLPQVIDFVDDQSYRAEIIIVDNNSTDDTVAIAQEFASHSACIRLLHEKEQGKGAAVHAGVEAAAGDYFFVADADFSMPVAEISKFLPPVLSGYDIAIGSREVAGAVRYNEPEYRHLMGRIFNWYVKLMAIPGFEDTQCGFKCFRREVARDVFASQTISGWAFDVEILYIGLRRGYRVVEVPINWTYRANSRISPLRDTIDMIREVLRIRYNGGIGRYDPPAGASTVTNET